MRLAETFGGCDGHSSAGLICGRCVKSTNSAGDRAGRLPVDLDLLLQSRSALLPAHEFLEEGLPIVRKAVEAG